jgi:hypothetical protein
LSFWKNSLCGAHLPYSMQSLSRGAHFVRCLLERGIHADCCCHVSHGSAPPYPVVSSRPRCHLDILSCRLTVEVGATVVAWASRQSARVVVIMTFAFILTGHLRAPPWTEAAGVALPSFGPPSSGAIRALLSPGR